MGIVTDKTFVPLELHRLCNVKDTAHILGFTEQTVRAWITSGKIKIYRSPGGSIRLWLPDILRAGTHSTDKRRPPHRVFPRRTTASPGNPPPEPGEASSE